MARNKGITNQEMYDGLKKRAGELAVEPAKPFIGELWKYFEAWPRYTRSIHTPGIPGAYKQLCGHNAESCQTVDEFFHPALLPGLKAFFGDEETGRIVEECQSLMSFPYSHSTYRPSYRSGIAGDYADLFFSAMINSLYYSCCGTVGALSRTPARVALDLQRGAAPVFAAVEEAILGDSDGEKLSHDIISAIAKSGDKKALELLGKLLLAAKGQEGLRQAVLETCDSGMIESHQYFIQLILDNGLCRFSSVVRAFGTWCGLPLGDGKQRTVEKMMSLALKFLGDENAAREALSSADATKIYMGLWAVSCRDVHSAAGLATELLESPEKYRRLTGWYFITNTNNDDFRHNLAMRFLDARDPEELAWVALNVKPNNEIARGYWGHNGYQEKDEREIADKTYPASYYPSSLEERAALFDKALDAALFIGKKSTKFSPSVFPGCDVELSASNLFGLMIGLAGYDRSDGLTLRIAENLGVCDSNNRLKFYGKLLNPNMPRHRALLLEGLSDKSPAVKETILKRLSFYPMGADDASALEKSLTTSNASLRKSVMSLLAKQESSFAVPMIERLLGKGNGAQMLAGAELLEIEGKKDPKILEAYKERVSALRTSGLGEDFEILAQQIYPESSGGELSPGNGFGLFDPCSEEFSAEYWASKRPAVAVLSDGELKAQIIPDDEAMATLYGRLLNVWQLNKAYGYETRNYHGGKETVLLGSRLARLSTYDKENPKGVYDYPLADQWLAAAEGFTGEPEKLAAIMSLWRMGGSLEYEGWFNEIFDGFPIGRGSNPAADKISEAFRAQDWWASRMDEIIHAIMHTCGGRSLFDFAMSAYVNLINKVPAHRLGDVCREKENHYAHSSLKVLEVGYLQYWRQLARRHVADDGQFAGYFSEIWYEYLASGKSGWHGLESADIFRAHGLGLISGEAVCYYLLTYPFNDHPFRTLTNKRLAKDVFEKYPAGKPLLDKALDAVVSVESRRGELGTALTRTVPHIVCFTGGAAHFATLLAALGSGGFSRENYFPYTQEPATKKASLSHLLRACLPHGGDTPGDLRDALKKAKITESRALQAALFAPQWAGLLEGALNIPGLKCGVWFFHAHINENFSAEKETETAIFSAISPQEFNDGAFDKGWFFEAYNALGEKRFMELYKNAKLITDSNITHRRSQLYTEAVLGRMDKAGALAEIKEKRNQERLRAYALIPLDEGGESDALARYEFINQFKKESRQFGSQRQASEGTAVAVALDNLAITAGYGDADRMSWALEGQKMEQLRPLMEPRVIGETTVRLVIHEDGTPEAVAEKKGKILKSMPKELSKDEYAADLKAAAKSLKDQKSRANLKFEMAMVSRTAFEPGEIAGLLQNPVLSGQVSSLAFASGGVLGFPVLNGGQLALKDYGNELHGVGCELIIAHPYDFMGQKCWGAYQRFLFENQATQPFKQVFREYYPITEDEKRAANVSTRYEGYQVQPKKAVALLKTRGWTVDYEEGLQRVWHKENLVARMYALADWFSPSDIEAPTLETIQFYRRGKWGLVPFDEVPPVVFSETMRDIDLVVSVAHAGGVDPEASHSTVEMRAAIARELLALLTVQNVTFKAAHAIVHGKLGEYSVHLGSGVVHKLGAGMIAVLPVHSQLRGRVFLPFADGDPKTAEVMSKILLFADDGKIKDPSILSQIASGN